MAKPVLVINNHDYAAYVQELNITRNDLDAEGSGRDVQTGTMHRAFVASKWKVEVKLLPVQEDVHKRLLGDISGQFYNASLVDPASGAQATKTFYTATTPYGAQRYNRETGKPYYSGMAFSMIEK